MKPSAFPLFTGIALIVALPLLGCGGGAQKDKDFFTSGSREADQRADQRMAKEQQVRGEPSKSKSGSSSGKAEDPNIKQPLFDRLGGEKGVNAIVDDFVNRALADPRVNWERRGVKSGGFLGIRKHSEEWKPDASSLANLKKHVAQFIGVAAGGPAQYDGGEMKAVHAGMKITNAEFDAAVGDLKATLDNQHIAVDEQKELLAIIESTRPQVVEER